MPVRTKLTAPVGLSEHDADLVRESSRTIARFARDGEPLHVTLTRQNGEHAEATVPGHALALVAEVLADMAVGKVLTTGAVGAELTTHQAAAVLRVSRPYLIKLLDTGKVPCRKVGTHRRVLRDDLILYMDQEKRARAEALNEMAAEAQRLGLYE